MIHRILILCLIATPLSGAIEQEEASQGEVENFKKAFSACLEAKDYMVKF
jgi:hypothetical protein